MCVIFVVVSFLLCGFNFEIFEILKLDLFGLGVNILVVWIGDMGLMGLLFDICCVWFNIISGMLMLCFYVSGFGVLVKDVYLIWLLVVIKFVFMIIVFIFDFIDLVLFDEVIGNMLLLFGFGVGYVCLDCVFDLGLVYDFVL